MVTRAESPGSRSLILGEDPSGETRTVGLSATGDVLIQPSNSASVDAFGRFRVSEPDTLFDSKQIFDNQPLFWDDQEVSGADTTSTHSANQASSIIGVGASTAGKRVRQTFMRFNYQPGKSQAVLMTGTLQLTGGGTGIVCGYGLFDDDNGIFLQDNEGTVEFVLRSNVTGSAVDTAIAQTAWSLDPMDGAGGSGITLDLSTSQVMIIDFEWLGVGRVRVGFVMRGEPIYVHEFIHGNVTEGVYMSTPNLPLRFEIANDGTGVASTLRHMCATVLSEGGQEDTGVLRYKSTEGTHVVAATENIIYAILGIKLKSTHFGATINIVETTVVDLAGNKNAEWVLLLNPTVADVFTYSAETNSAVEIAVGVAANTVTSGTAIAGGFFTSTNRGGSDTAKLLNALRLGSTIAGVADEFVLCGRPVGGSTNLNFEGSLTWRELS